jgi:hypothetical protein
MGGFRRVSGVARSTPTPSRCAGEWPGCSTATSSTGPCTRCKTPLAFGLRGFERVDGQDGGYGVVQEWHIEMP